MDKFKEIMRKETHFGDIKRFKCQMCGSCCKDPKILLCVDYDDIKRWEAEDRPDILGNITLTVNSKAYEGTTVYEMPRDMEHCCSFFNKKSKRCNIHDTKPNSCKLFPFAAGKEIRCEGIGNGPKFRPKLLKGKMIAHQNNILKLSEPGVVEEVMNIRLRVGGIDDTEEISEKLKEGKPDFYGDFSYNGHYCTYKVFTFKTLKDIDKKPFEKIVKESIDAIPKDKEYSYWVNTVSIYNKNEMLAIQIIIFTKEIELKKLLDEGDNFLKFHMSYMDRTLIEKIGIVHTKGSIELENYL